MKLKRLNFYYHLAFLYVDLLLAGAASALSLAAVFRGIAPPFYFAQFALASASFVLALRWESTFTRVRRERLYQYSARLGALLRPTNSWWFVTFEAVAAAAMVWAKRDPWPFALGWVLTDAFCNWYRPTVLKHYAQTLAEESAGG